MEWSQLYLHNEYWLKILSFFYQGQVARLLEMTLCGATACQRQPFLMHSFRYFSNKKVEIAIFCLDYQTRSMVESHKSPLQNDKCHFWFYRPLGSLGTKASSKTINKHVRQYFSTSSLIARPVNGLLFLFGSRTDDFSCQI